jgi:hypothetical protein
MKIEVIAYQRPDLMAYDAQMSAYIGLDVYQYLFRGVQEVRRDTGLLLIFPERWLNIVEQRELISRITERMPWVSSVTIKTHSPFILQMVRSECIQVVLGVEGELHTDDPLAIFNQGGITILRGSKQ